MDFDLNEFQKMLAGTARDFLKRECPSTLVREMEEAAQGYPPELYRKMADLGWFGLCLPEKYGGSGGDLLDLMVLLEEMGRVLLPGPFFATVVLGGLPLLAFGSESQRQRFLPQIAAGELNFTLALIEPGSRYELDSIQVKADRAENGYVINGVKLLVPYAHVADFIITAARTEAGTSAGGGISLLISDNKQPGVTCRVLPTIAMDKQCEVIFENAAVPEENILGVPGCGNNYLEEWLQQATVALCAQMIGGCRRVLDMAVDYAKQRVLFGRPMGNFQIIQGYFAEMLALLEDAYLLTYQAGWKLDRGVPCTREVSMAKARTSQAFRTAAELGHRIHGGVGYALEHDMGLYFRRAKAAEITFGNADFHFDKIAIQLGL